MQGGTSILTFFSSALILSASDEEYKCHIAPCSGERKNSTKINEPFVEIQICGMDFKC